MKVKTQKLVLMGLLVATALILSIIENLLPVPTMIPGAKLGLANIITMVSLLMLTPYETLVVLLARIFLGAVFAGGFSGFLYSLGGGLLSYGAMLLVIRIFSNRISAVGISATGAYFHSLGQVLVAAIMIQNIRIVSYLPVILSTSLVAGVFIGFAARNLLELSVIRRLFGSIR